MFAGVDAPVTSRLLSDSLIKLSQASEGLAHIPYDDSDHWIRRDSEHCFAIVQQRYWNTPQSKRVTGIIAHAPSQTRIAAWARIDNRAELKNKLPKELHPLCVTDDGSILAAYLYWGVTCCDQLVGDFAFAVVDERSQTIFLGRDHTGVKPLYYYYDGRQFAFATSLGILNQLPGLDLTLSEQWLARYLVSASEDWEMTVYKRINKLPPAHTLTFNDKKLTLRQYFKFSLESDLILSSDEEYVEAYREVLHQAVACRTHSDYPLGSESSGGLDSSSVTALAARTMQQPGRHLHAFGYDESKLTPQCIIDISQTNPIAMTHFASKTRAGDPQITSLFHLCHGAPVEHTNGISHNMFYNVSQKLGIRTLLSGFGGDEFVTSAAPVALVEFWRDKSWRLFLSRQRGNYLTKPLHTLRWLYLYYRFDNHSITSRRLQMAAQRGWSHQLLKSSVVEQYNLQSLAQKGNIYDGGQTLQNGFALNNRWSPNMTARYENCTLMAAYYGIDYRWPLMDIRLLKLFLSIPAHQKLGPGSMGRYLHRRAVAEILPNFITWKDKDMVTIRWWQRLLSWITGRPFKEIFKGKVKQKITTESGHKQKPRSSRTLPIRADHKPVTRLQVHPLIEAIIDTGKLNYTIQSLENPNLPKEQRMPMQAHLRQLRRLDHWLNNRLQTDEDESQTG